MTVPINNQPEEILITWQVPARPFKARNREVFLTSGAIVALISLIALLAKEWLFIAVLLSLYFVFWVLNSVAPDQAQHSLTSKAVVTGDKKYPWENLIRYWFTAKWNNQILNIETQKTFPRQLMMLLPPNPDQVAKIKKIFNEKLKLEEPTTTWLNHASEWIQKKVPLEKE